MLYYCNDLKSAEKDTNKPNSFSIGYDNRIFYFYCDYKEDQRKWLGLVKKMLVLPTINILRVSDHGSSHIGENNEKKVK